MIKFNRIKLLKLLDYDLKISYVRNIIENGFLNIVDCCILNPAKVKISKQTILADKYSIVYFIKSYNKCRRSDKKYKYIDPSDDFLRIEYNRLYFICG